FFSQVSIRFDKNGVRTPVVACKNVRSLEILNVCYIIEALLSVHRGASCAHTNLVALYSFTKSAPIKASEASTSSSLGGAERTRSRRFDQQLHQSAHSLSAQVVF